MIFRMPIRTRPGERQCFLPAFFRPGVAADIRALAQLEGPTSIAALVGVRDDPKSPPAARVASSQALPDRGFGRPRQTLTARLIRSVRDLTTEELEVLGGEGDAAEIRR